LAEAQEKLIAEIIGEESWQGLVSAVARVANGVGLAGTAIQRRQCSYDGL